MDKAVFARIRQHLEKTQRELAAMLGISLKGVQSFEQGWRSIPAHVERQMLFLAAMKGCRTRSNQPCWMVKNCPDEMRRTCPAWGLQTRDFCWMVNGMICRGRIQKSWDEKMEFCRNCEMFQSMTAWFAVSEEPTE
ncbi:helix-turn-helix domain-containing protein [Desulfococcus sp.]|uniref:helix-turn-helix domain-containing protein n=1 Tax=Desulfococcus sp. TaxID=2025834 RepID=UPI00359477B5